MTRKQHKKPLKDIILRIIKTNTKLYGGITMKSIINNVHRMVEKGYIRHLVLVLMKEGKVESWWKDENHKDHKFYRIKNGENKS
jgi:hypothetical protein